ncbi:MAG: hypothetical protein AAGE65_14075 [Planctomycetota bacterium]
MPITRNRLSSGGRMIRSLLLLLATSMTLAGCVEPYPAFSVAIIPEHEFPGKANQAFRVDHPDARVSEVQQSTFMSRNTGYPKLYRIFFETDSAKRQSVVYDRFGNRIKNAGHWFGPDSSAETQPPDGGA